MRRRATCCLAGRERPRRTQPDRSPRFDRLALDLIRAFLAAEWGTEMSFRRRVSQLTDLEQAAADELRPAPR